MNIKKIGLTALAEIAIREPARADTPIFLMFILITPLINC